jgi:hypothetical protein
MTVINASVQRLVYAKDQMIQGDFLNDNPYFEYSYSHCSGFSFKTTSPTLVHAIYWFSITLY